jgi:UDP-N-acetylglucosamine 2-epimerase (non-hydrolysing)
MIHITLVAGARPNFMKIAPIIHAIKKRQNTGSQIDFSLIHTGQHYDNKMSGQFFVELEIPEPTTNLEAGGGTQAEQTAAIMIGFERYLVNNPTNLVLVVGDVTSTMACAIVSQKLGIPVAHVEGGIRSNDWSMPEEINRLVTDAITNLFFTTSEVANTNLRNSGIHNDRIHFVGNTMIDTLLKQRPFFEKPVFWDQYNLKEKAYFVVTLHRPANVDDPAKLKALLENILLHSKGYPLVFPVHPRTAKTIASLGLKNDQFILCEPMGYRAFNYLVERSFAVITDSGGITEETTVLEVPCMTLRDNTERPETVSQGTNELLGTNPNAIGPALEKLFSGNWKKGQTPELWDGKTAERIVDILLNVNL